MMRSTLRRTLTVFASAIALYSPFLTYANRVVACAIVTTEPAFACISQVDPAPELYWLEQTDKVKYSLHDIGQVDHELAVIYDVRHFDDDVRESGVFKVKLKNNGDLKRSELIPVAQAAVGQTMEDTQIGAGLIETLYHYQIMGLRAAREVNKEAADGTNIIVTPNQDNHGIANTSNDFIGDAPEIDEIRALMVPYIDKIGSKFFASTLFEDDASEISQEGGSPTKGRQYATRASRDGTRLALLSYQSGASNSIDLSSDLEQRPRSLSRWVHYALSIESFVFSRDGLIGVLLFGMAYVAFDGLRRLFGVKGGPISPSSPSPAIRSRSKGTMSRRSRVTRGSHDRRPR